MYFQSRDRDDGYTIQSPYQKTPHTTLRASVQALSSITPELLPIEVLIARTGHFVRFCYCDFDLDPMTFIGLYELDPYPLKTCPQKKNELCSQGVRKLSFYIHTYIQTDRQTDGLSYWQTEKK